MKEREDEIAAKGEVNPRIRHKIPAKGRIRDDRSKAILERCINMIKYELGRLRYRRDGEFKKLPSVDRAYNAIEIYMEQLAELDEEICNATIYDLGLTELIADKLEFAGLVKVRALVQLTVSELKSRIFLKADELEELITKLSEIGEHFVGTLVSTRTTQFEEPSKAAKRQTKRRGAKTR